MASITPSYDREGEHIGWKASVRKRGFPPQCQTFRTRKKATSRLFEKGFNPMEVSAITGHKTLQMLKRYTYLRAEDLAKRTG